MKCSRCEKKIPRGAPFWQKTEGWTQRRMAGGVNQVVLREPKEEFMCEPCMHLRRAGSIPGQMPL